MREFSALKKTIMAARFVLNSPPSDFFDFFSQTTLPDM